MTTVLALETSFSRSSVALLDEEGVVFEFTLRHGRDLSRRLISVLDHGFRASGRDKREVDLVAASAGPGSFTGLRIGVTAAKTLAYALGARAAAVSTLEALAEGSAVAVDDLVAPIIDARRNEVFSALFRRSSAGFERLPADELLTTADLPRFLTAVPRAAGSRVIAVAAGAVSGLEEVLWGVPGVTLVEAYPQARHVAAIAARHADAGESMDPLELLPLYLRRSYAEEQVDPQPPKI